MSISSAASHKKRDILHHCHSQLQLVRATLRCNHGLTEQLLHPSCTRCSSSTVVVVQYAQCSIFFVFYPICQNTSINVVLSMPEGLLCNFNAVTPFYAGHMVAGIARLKSGHHRPGPRQQSLLSSRGATDWRLAVRNQTIRLQMCPGSH